MANISKLATLNRVNYSSHPDIKTEQIACKPSACGRFSFPSATSHNIAIRQKIHGKKCAAEFFAYFFMRKFGETGDIVYLCDAKQHFKLL